MRAIGYFSEFPTRKTSEGLNLDLENPRQSLSKQNDDFLSYCDTNGIEPAAAFIEALPAAGVNRNDTERMGLRQLLDYLGLTNDANIIFFTTGRNRLPKIIFTPMMPALLMAKVEKCPAADNDKR